MIYLLFAEIVFIIHFLWIIFLVFGCIWGRKYKIIKTIHISGLLFAVILQLFGWYCPLTYLESWLRTKYSSAYMPADSFIIYYLEKIIYLDISPNIIFILTIALLIITFFIYFRSWSFLSF